MILIYKPLNVVAGACVWVCVLAWLTYQAAGTGHPSLATLFATAAAVIAWIGLKMLVRFYVAWLRLLRRGGSL